MLSAVRNFFRRRRPTGIAAVDGTVAVVKHALKSTGLVSAKMEPINMLPLDGSPEAIKRAADHAYSIGSSYLAKVSDWVKRPLQGMNVLELGPGPDFGSTLLLTAFGARVAVADRWLTPWQAHHHGPVYAALADRIEAEHPSADVSALRALVAANAYLPEIISQYEDAEKLIGIPDNEFDMVVSNAVFEHILDHRKASDRCFAVTKPGGFNVHQVDFRDHRDFTRPLEFLLMTADEIAAFMAETDTHEGNQRRASDYQAAYRDMGFDVLSAWVTEQASEAYLADFLPRLRAMPTSPYHGASLDDLRIGGITYVLRKPL